MGSNGRSIEMSKDHKPDCEIEIERITKAGSTITEGRVDGNLNLTRSLGDLKHKDKRASEATAKSAKLTMVQLVSATTGSDLIKKTEAQK